MNGSSSVRYLIIIAVVAVIAVVVGGFLRLAVTTKQKSQDKPNVVAVADSSGTASKSPGSAASVLPQPRSRAERAKPEGKYRDQLLLVDQFLQGGQVDKALSVLEEILAQDPNNEQALEQMGMIHMTDLQDPDKAIGFFKRVLTLNPNNDFALMEMVGASVDPRRSPETMEYLQALLRANPNSLGLSDGIGELLMSQGRLTEAIPHLEKSATDPKFAEFSYSRLASVYEQKGDLDKASENYQKSIGAQTEEIQRRRSAGQPIDMVEIAMARNQMELARLFSTRGRYQEAEDLIARAGTYLDRSETEGLLRWIQRKRQESGER